MATSSIGRGDHTTEEPQNRRHITDFWWPVGVFLAVALVLFLVIWIGNSAFPDAPEGGPQPITPLDSVLGGWARYDAGWYIGIAEGGYWYAPGVQSAVAFFPAYPLAMRVMSAVTGSTATAGMLISFLSGLGAAVLWWSWLRMKVSLDARRVSFLLLLLWPYAWYLYGAVYADALFLVATLGAFVLLEHDHPVLAGLTAAVATAARPVGIAVVIGLVAWIVDRRRRADGLHPRDAGVLLGLVGLALWCLYLWVEFGDPVAFVSAQQGWEQGQRMETWLKLPLIEMVSDLRPHVIRLIPHALATLGFLAFVPAVIRRFGWGYGLYTLTVVGIPFIGSSTFQGLGRYLMAAFPVYALVGEWLASRPRLAVAALIVSGLGLMFGAALFSMGWYVS